MRLANRRILVTGGASGIGLEATRRFLGEGARVAVIDRNPAALEALAAQLPAAIALKADVSDEAQVATAVAEAGEKLDGLDGLANVAGIGTRKSFDETTLKVLMTDLNVNLIGPFLVCKAAVPWMRKAGGGAIVNVSSGLALRPTEGRTAYGASKGALIVMSKAIAVDLAADNIRVNVVCPGLIDTPLVANATHGALFTPAQFEKLMDRRLIRRMGRPQELADALLFLMSEESSFMTASVLAVDGGGSMH
ncbi:2-(R)-hydroxypropyl-CoM dehydrogenase [Variovorax sp. SRS16]|uniref:SDR family NAD(P)-dependent oxidoreductase n=1 Tax=Variovorax sp. SRS16 TaxID=282217 RepID=UPI0013185208|nr:SDR family oxidoreductase [Variovorax sp. SRS16]VTU13184.1 2-(R)-hydroxypropyl-CoM dehydrogenase [Variovorax sp. SRS16]